MDNRPVISVVIPTYNRYKYLKDCLSATLSIPSSKLEIVVQDNTEDNSDILPFIESIDDKRLVYNHLPDHVDVSKNCDLAVEKANGEYVCLIGDDDTVCSNIVDLAEFMRVNAIDTCVFGICTYHWPDLLQRVPSLNCFESPLFKGYFAYCDTKKLLYSCLNSGIQSIKFLPRAYHAIASKALLLSVKEKTGSFFPGPSPDMANAMACTLHSQKHLQTDLPVMISGYGESSGGGQGRQNLHKGSLRDKPWLPDNIEEIWDSKIPRLWMGNTIWPASAIAALKVLGREDLLKEVNYGAICAETLYHDPGSFKEVVACDLKLSDFGQMVIHGIKRVAKRISDNGLNSKEFALCVKDPITIMEAKYMQETLNASMDFHRIDIGEIPE